MARPLIVGADLSSKSLALVARHPVTPTSAVVKYPLRTQAGRYTPAVAAEAMACMWEWLDTVQRMAVPGGPRLAYVEQPLVGRGGTNATIVQCYVNGVVQACLVQAGFEVTLVHPSTWKAALTHDPHATKDDVGRCVRSRWPSVHRACQGDTDLQDAAAICLFGQLRHRTEAR